MDSSGRPNQCGRSDEYIRAAAPIRTGGRWQRTSSLLNPHLHGP